MSVIVGTLIVIIGFLIGLLFLGVFLHKKKLMLSFEKAHLESNKILEEARREADLLVKAALKEGKEESRLRRKTFEDDAKKRKSEIQKLEKKIKTREQLLSSKQTSLESREERLKEIELKLESEERAQLRLKAEYELALEKNRRTLEKIANMSGDEAKRELLEIMEEDAKKEAKKMVRQIEEDARKEALQKSRELISLSVQRLAGDYVNDSTVTVVSLPSEEMKGRIIGREGRNIRALEYSTGVDLIIDDTPEAVIISCFNPIRREIAKITLEKLIADGRIHPARIEETAKKVESEFNNIIREYGEQAAFDVGVTDLHPQILTLLGKLKFRTANQQSLLNHALETAQISGILAAELGLDIKLAKRAGLLHDIGKAVNQDAEGHHSDVGADICKKYGEGEEVIAAVRYHHAEDVLNLSPLAVLVGAANSLSANRPQARQEQLAKYIRRLSKMEDLIREFKGIETAYVLQAGREVRAFVKSDETSDEDVRDLSNDIAMKLRHELTFPGQVKITVLRESKVTLYAT